MTTQHLIIRGLHVEFGTPRGVVHALRGVDLDIRAGRTTCLIGESGSGKSVTGRAILGLLPQHVARIHSGSICLEDRELLDLSERDWAKVRGREIAMVFQDPSRALNPTRRIGDQVGEAIGIHFPTLSRREVEERVVAHLDAVRLPRAREQAKRFPHELSGGMRQRVAIAMALSAEPKVLVADEPTTALDVTTQIQILELLRQLQREREMTVLLITHDMGVAAHYSDDVAVMYAGRIVEHAPTKQLFDNVRMPYTEGLLNSLPSTVKGRHELEPVPGGPPDLSVPLVGCSFAARCSRAADTCTKLQPPKVVTGEHGYECWHPTGRSEK